MARDHPRGSRQPRPSPQNRPSPRPSPLSQEVLHSSHSNQSYPNIPRPFSVAPSVAPTIQSLAASEARGDVTLVEDPIFWKRFSAAIHEADVSEQHKAESKLSKKYSKAGLKTEAVAGEVVEGVRTNVNRASGFSGRDTWLQQQKREKRKCRLICVLIIGLAIAIIVAVVIVLVVVLKI